MKKLILTSIALSISIMSACTPTPAVNGVNGMMTPANGNAMGGSKVTKAQVMKYFDCVIEKAQTTGKKDLAGINIMRTSWSQMPDSVFETSITSPQQLRGLTMAYAELGCTL